MLILAIVLALSILYFIIWGKRRLRFKRSILKEVMAIEESYAHDQDVARLQASVSALLRRIVFLKNQKNLKRAVSLDQANPSLIEIFPDQKRTETLISLLTKDRFHKAPDVDGAFLLKLVREQIKRCRI